MYMWYAQIYYGSFGYIITNFCQAGNMHFNRKRHSCETQLTTIINDWVKILDKRGQVDTVILYFEKAFDTRQITQILN